MDIKEIKIGDLVRCSQDTVHYQLGFVTDIFEDQAIGYPMFEVVVSDPYDRGWFTNTQLEVIS